MVNWHDTCHKLTIPKYLILLINYFLIFGMVCATSKGMGQATYRFKTGRNIFTKAQIGDIYPVAYNRRSGAATIWECVIGFYSNGASQTISRKTRKECIAYFESQGYTKE